jgi:hypothetical protein
MIATVDETMPDQLVVLKDYKWNRKEALEILVIEWQPPSILVLEKGQIVAQLSFACSRKTPLPDLTSLPCPLSLKSCSPPPDKPKEWAIWIQQEVMMAYI